jgi:hypothetical protein
MMFPHSARYERPCPSREVNWWDLIRTARNTSPEVTPRLETRGATFLTTTPAHVVPAPSACFSAAVSQGIWREQCSLRRFNPAHSNFYRYVAGVYVVDFGVP